MADELHALIQANLDLYQKFIDENVAADRAQISGTFSQYLEVQAKSAREAIGIDGDGNQSAEPAA